MQHVEIGGAGAAHGNVDVASRLSATFDCRSELYDQLEIGNPFA